MSEQSHFPMMACLYSSLHAHFGQGADVYVAVQTPLHYEQEQPTLSKQPDIMVIKGTNSEERLRFNLWEEEAVPAVVFEITSGQTWLEDLVNKSALYMQLGIQEYFIFDPYGEFLKDHVQGLRLATQNGHHEYVPIPVTADGILKSEELGINLVAKEHLLRLIDVETEEMIPWADELKGYVVPAREGEAADGYSSEVVQQLETRLQEAEVRTRQAEERARQAEERAEQNQAQPNGQDAQRIKTLEGENAHLRVLLGQMQGTKVMR